MIKKNDKKLKGFTLVEILISIAIFTVVSIVMSNIIISTVRFSVDNERRSDFMTELDNIANGVKNDLRGADKVSICPDGRIVRFDGNKYYKLTEDLGSIKWDEVQNDTTCAAVTTAGKRVINLSSNNIKINKVLFDSENAGNGDPNNIMYVMVEACDPDNGFTRKIFDCTENPYRYIFGITSRIVPTPTP